MMLQASPHRCITWVWGGFSNHSSPTQVKDIRPAAVFVVPVIYSRVVLEFYALNYVNESNFYISRITLSLYRKAPKNEDGRTNKKSYSFGTYICTHAGTSLHSRLAGSLHQCTYNITNDFFLFTKVRIPIPMLPSFFHRLLRFNEYSVEVF